MTILTVGVDLAKNVFAVHRRSEQGKAELLRPAVPRAKLLALIASLPPCVVAMEACSGADHWARQFAQFGHTLRLIAPKFVTSYRHTGPLGKDNPAQRLMRLGGVGQTTATAILAMIGNGHDFKCGRQSAAWLGLVPGQYSSGGMARLGRITEAGDAHLRILLGARAVLAAAKSKTDSISTWAFELEKSRCYWKTLGAIAAKNARMAWAVLAKGEAFRRPA